MEHYPSGLNTIRQLQSEHISDGKSRLWQVITPSIPSANVICPQPRRASHVPSFMGSMNRATAKTNGILPMSRVDSSPDILDIILGKNDPDEDLDSSCQMGFFCGSPPIRTNNPIVCDAQFAKQTQSLASPLGNSLGKMPTGRAEVGSPSCGASFGGNPQVRIEGFTCGNSESHCIVPAFG
ncbi:uncharacterized protein [Typha latifolia]|uniref:uncharacterized protein n=1 Tax=Typha latifolia TaxID=4733 RepID=UPI003C2ED5F1